MSTRPQRTVFQTSLPNHEVVVTDDGSRTLREISSGITWHSESGAMAETELVFLRNSSIEERLSETRSSDSEPVRVLEIGFGTGLNFWITASNAIQAKSKLSYVAIEPRLLPFEIVMQLEHSRLPPCQPAYNLFCTKIFKDRMDSVCRESVSLNIVSELALFANLKTPESRELIKAYDPSLTAETVGIETLIPSGFDAIYHDPFSPEVAPELWTTDFFEECWSLLKPYGRLVTYCVKSSVQRTLRDSGFEIEKTRGPFGGKREVLIAHRGKDDGNG